MDKINKRFMSGIGLVVGLLGMMGSVWISDNILPTCIAICSAVFWAFSLQSFEESKPK